MSPLVFAVCFIPQLSLRGQSSLTLTKHFSLCQVPQHLMCINSIPITTIVGGTYYYAHFTDEETEEQRLSNLSKIAQLAGGKAEI